MDARGHALHVMETRYNLRKIVETRGGERRRVGARAGNRAIKRGSAQTFGTWWTSMETPRSAQKLWIARGNSRKLLRAHGNSLKRGKAWGTTWGPVGQCGKRRYVLKRTEIRGRCGKRRERTEASGNTWKREQAGQSRSKYEENLEPCGSL